MLRLRTLFLVLSPLAVSGAAVAQQQPPPQWTRLGGVPLSLGWPVFDPVRDRVIAFTANGQVFNDPIRAFEWNGRWQPHQQATESGLASIAGAVCDRTRGEVLVVGAPSTFGNSSTVTSIYVAGRFRAAIAGVPFRGAGLVHDAVHGEVLAFGGSGAGNSVVDTMWRWTGATWSQVNQPALRPPARKAPALVFDWARGNVVMFGGSDGFVNAVGDTWLWDGAAWQPGAGGPAPRERAGFVFDAATGTCLLHGGYERQNEIAGTWLWNGVAWTQVPVANPPGSGWLVETSGRPLLLREGALQDNGTFQWTGAGFVPVAAPLNALTRYESTLVYDAARAELVLFGGQPTAGGLWTWNGEWHHRGLLPNGPVGRRGHSMTYDAARQRIVMFGGRDADVGGLSLGDTWTWDGTTWTRHTPANAPTARHSAGFAYDAARGNCVLFGGFSPSFLGDTWLWDGATWTTAQPSVSPSPRWGQVMVDDEQRQRVVLLNGSISSGTVLETWEWDGATWLQRSPLAQPSGALAYDRQRAAVVVATAWGALHAWDGAEWQAVPVFSPPANRPVALSMTWHDALGRLVLYQGGPTGESLWALTPTPPLAETFAEACPGSTTNDCDLLALGLPRPGNNLLELDLRTRAANAPGAAMWGLAPGSFPVGGGCAVLIDVPILGELVYTNAGGFGRLRTPIPDNVAFLGVNLHVQGFVLDGQGPIGGASASAGLRLQIGR